MKKILIITTRPSTSVGGMELYVWKLARHLKNKYEVIILSLLNNNSEPVREKIGNIREIETDSKAYVYPFKQVKAIRDVIATCKPDLIINNHHKTTKAILKFENVIQVQHFTSSYYDLNEWSLDIRIKSFLDYYFLGLFSNKNPLLTSKVSVSFRKTGDNFYPILLPYNYKITKNTLKKEKGIIFIGRLTEVQKNISFMNTIELKNDEKITVIGSGPDENMLERESVNILGRLPAKDTILQLRKHKVLILPSNFEGFPFVIIEAISNGVPVVAFDSFEDSIFYSKLSFVHIIKKGDSNSFNDSISHFLNMSESESKKMSAEMYKFSKKHFGEKSFFDKWDSLLLDIFKKHK